MDSVRKATLFFECLQSFAMSFHLNKLSSLNFANFISNFTFINYDDIFILSRSCWTQRFFSIKKHNYCNFKLHSHSASKEYHMTFDRINFLLDSYFKPTLPSSYLKLRTIRVTPCRIVRREQRPSLLYLKIDQCSSEHKNVNFVHTTIWPLYHIFSLLCVAE